MREHKVGWLYARTGKNPNTLIEALRKSGQIGKDEMWYEEQTDSVRLSRQTSLDAVIAAQMNVKRNPSHTSVSSVPLDAEEFDNL